MPTLPLPDIGFMNTGKDISPLSSPFFSSSRELYVSTVLTPFDRRYLNISYLSKQRWAVHFAGQRGKMPLLTSSSRCFASISISGSITVVIAFTSLLSHISSTLSK